MCIVFFAILGITIISIIINKSTKHDMNVTRENQNLNKLDAKIVVNYITSAWNLKEQGMLNQIEFEKQKNSAIERISNSKVVQSTNDFLYEMTPLLQRGILTASDMQCIKKLLENKF